jgi:hypothetical protein
MRLSRRKWMARLVTGLALFGCTSKPNQSQNSPVSPALSPEKLRTAAEKRQNFRRGQDARMRSALSPLARVDYQHIPIGQHPVGLEVSSPLHLFASLRSGFGGQLVVSRLGSEVTFPCCLSGVPSLFPSPPWGAASSMSSVTPSSSTSTGRSSS